MRILLVFGLLLTLAGCGGNKIVVNGIEVYESYWLEAIDKLAPRASHDMGCSRDQLQFTLFSRVGRHPNQIGVIGCGRRATYTRPTVRGAGGTAISETWILDGTVAETGPSGGPPPAQATPPPPGY